MNGDALPDRVYQNGEVQLNLGYRFGELETWPGLELGQVYRGPGGLGIGKAKGLPATWSDAENVVWKAPLPGAGASSPIVLGDRLYLTSYSG